VGEEDLSCDPAGPCRLRPLTFDDAEARVLWSTPLATYLDVAHGLEHKRAIDLGAGVGLTCVVLASG